MRQNQTNITYALLALALAASLLYRPVIAADSDAPRTPTAQPGAGGISEPLRQDFDALISEIEARQPAPAPAATSTLATGTVEEQLDAARIQIGILQQAVIAALAERAEAEAELEALWRDSRAEIDGPKAGPGAGTTPASSESTLARTKGEAPGDPTAEATGSAADIAPAAGPVEVMLSEIHFNPGSAALTPGGERKALEAADKIRSFGASNVRVSGYTDTQGPAAYNVHLSLQRAKSIADLLESVGISAEIIEVEGHGEDGAPEPTGDRVSEPLNRCAGIFAMVDSPPDQQ